MDKLLYILAAVNLLLLLWLCSLLPRYGERKLGELRGFRYAHRGLHNARRGIPENSVLAYRYALAGGFGAEIDVRLTKDRQLVVIHDSDLRRLCGVKGRVEEMTLGELKQLRLQGTDECIPLLEDVLSLFCGKAPLIIELKSEGRNYRSLCERVCRMLESYQGDFCVESFDPRVLWWLRRNEPFIIRGQLSQNFLSGGEGGRLSWPGRLLLTGLVTNLFTRPDFVAYRFEDRQRLSMRVCRELLRVQEVSWTIRTQEDIELVESTGGMAIFEGFLPKGRVAQTTRAG